MATNRPKRLFLSYATEDEQYREQFDQALAGVRRAGLVSMWTFREIVPGADLDHAITTSIEQADIIALLVSPAFLASDYCWNVEMKRAVELYDAGKAALVPMRRALLRLGRCSTHWRALMRFLEVPDLSRDRRAEMRRGPASFAVSAV